MTRDATAIMTEPATSTLVPPALSPTPPQPPVAREAPVTSVVHGERRVDPFAWLREKSDPGVIAHLEAENAYTAAMMAHTGALQERLYAEILGRVQETDLSVPERKDDYFYYARTVEGLAYPIHCRKQGSLDGPETVLLDVNALAEGQAYTRVGVLAVSPDHRWLAYTVDHSGYAIFTLHVKDLDTGEVTEDRLERVDYSVAWANDNRTLYYTTTDEAHRPHRLYRHRLGASQADDVLLLEEPDARFRVFAYRARSGRFVLVGVNSAQTSEWRVLDADRPDEPPRVVAPREDKVEYSIEHHGERFLIVTNADGATNFKLMEAPVDRPGRDQWRELVAHRPEVKLDRVMAFAGHLVIAERRQGLPCLEVRDLASGEAHDIAFPEPAYMVWPEGNREFATKTLRFVYSSLVTPWSVFDYDMATRTRELKKEEPVLGGFDRRRYRSERLSATAPDGTAVPISLVFRADRQAGRPAPLLLYGYGSYGASMDASFNAARLSLLDRGFTFAIAHIRGGGEMGRPWYDDGKLLRKQNTFTDFIACAEHLIAAGYTVPDRLAIMGASAGGLLVGAVVNLRPELFRCAVAKVPFVDVINTMLDPTIPLTTNEYEEWGDPSDPTDYAYMRSYAPYDNVTAQDYPELLVTAGLNDPAVHYWEPAKWVARLRATKTDDHRLLLKARLDSGHSGPSGRYDAYREMAFEYAFILDTLGVEGRQG